MDYADTTIYCPYLSSLIPGHTPAEKVSTDLEYMIQQIKDPSLSRMAISLL